MKNNIVISGWSYVSHNQLKVNGDLVLELQAPDFADFAKAGFKALNQPYLKFYKMDNLSKLGFLCAEYLLQQNSIQQKYAPEEVGVILCNAASCIDTDMEHQKSIADVNNYFPSPSIFVYTLPNIVIGEISIRHKFQGENTFFIFETFQPEFMVNYVNSLFHGNKVKACLTGWVDLLPNALDYKAVFYLTEMGDGNAIMEFNSDNLKKIYNQ
jgi:hypothetical protein